MPPFLPLFPDSAEIREIGLEPLRASGEIFLNNELLANGHAVRMDEYSLTDWDG